MLDGASCSHISNQTNVDGRGTVSRMIIARLNRVRTGGDATDTGTEPQTDWPRINYQTAGHKKTLSWNLHCSIRSTWISILAYRRVWQTLRSSLQIVDFQSITPKPYPTSSKKTLTCSIPLSRSGHQPSLRLWRWTSCPTAIKPRSACATTRGTNANSLRNSWPLWSETVWLASIQHSHGHGYCFSY